MRGVIVAGAKPGSKYFKLFTYLQAHESEEITLQFEEIETIIASPLPPSARRNRGFWSNRGSGGVQASAWMDAGYQVDDVDLESERVHFSKLILQYEVSKSAGEVAWDGKMIRALRKSMGLNQSEFADVLGVRQQTISEWEGGLYQPTRARSKHINIIAERHAFFYIADEE